KKLGIDVQTNILEINAFNQKVKSQHEFDVVVGQPVKIADPDLTQQWAFSSYPNGQNWVGYSNREVDQVLRQAATVAGCGQQERKQFYDRAQQIVVQDLPALQLYSRVNILAANKRLQGLAPSAWAGDEVNFQGWVVTPKSK